MFSSQSGIQTPVQKEAGKHWNILVGTTIGHPVPDLVSREALADRVRLLRRQGMHDAARELLVYKSSCAGK